MASSGLQIPRNHSRIRNPARKFPFLLVCLLALSTAPGFALDPDFDMSQYAHTSWRIRDGFAKSRIESIAQTPDGYLWVGTALGLWRFDGARNVQWQPPAGAALPDSRIRTLLAARDSTLWIGTWRGLASWNGHSLTTYPRFNDLVVNTLVQDGEGTVWVGARSSTTGLLCSVRDSKVQCTGEDGRFGASASTYQDRSGTLWAAGTDSLWRWNADSPTRYALPEPFIGSLQSLGETSEGNILIVTRNGIRQLVDGRVIPFPLPQMPQDIEYHGLLRDGGGSIWIGTDYRGLLHFHDGRFDVFDHTDGLSDDRVMRVFEDREGNVWVATIGGLDRFGPLSVATYSSRQGVSGPQGSILAANDGSIWFASTDGLYRWYDERLLVYRGQSQRPSSSSSPAAGTTRGEVIVSGLPGNPWSSLFEDRRQRLWLGTRSGLGYLDRDKFVSVHDVPGGFIDSIAEDAAGNLWIAHRDAGLLQLSPDLKVHRAPLPIGGKPGDAWRLAFDPKHDDLWIGRFSGGVAVFANGRMRAAYTVADGLGKGIVNDLRVASDGTAWAATDGGLSRIKAGRIATLNSKNGLPCDAVHSSVVDEEGSTWIYMACGLVQITRSSLDAWMTAVDSGLSPPTIAIAVLDAADGVGSFPTPYPSTTPHLAIARDGKVWFIETDGVSVVDPRNLHRNTLPPPVHVEQVVADRTTYDASSPLRLPPLVRDIQIDYTALSLVAPETNQFRYKLDGHDREWQDVGNRRQAFYNDLSPGNYQFRVVASNNSGVWNEQGAALDFSIAPAYWQTSWFRATCVAIILVVLWALYQLRLRQIRQAFDARLEERVGERTRIARDLHDTLLQSFQGLLLRFQTAYELYQTRPADGKKVLESAIDQTAQAITQGREAVQGLRASTVERNDLARAITTLAEGIAAEASSHASVKLQVGVEGTPQNLHPIVRDEIYRIASEALRNAFRHAESNQIEVELRYDERQIRLRIRDDGKGIDPKFLTDEGRAGHFGLHGMRERAKLVRGKLSVWTAPNSGTEIELSIPAAHAYTASSAPWPSWFTEKFSGGGRRSGHEPPSQSDSDSVD